VYTSVTVVTVILFPARDWVTLKWHCQLDQRPDDDDDVNQPTESLPYLVDSADDEEGGGLRRRWIDGRGWRDGWRRRWVSPTADTDTMKCGHIINRSSVGRCVPTRQADVWTLSYSRGGATVGRRARDAGLRRWRSLDGHSDKHSQRERERERQTDRQTGGVQQGRRRGDGTTRSADGQKFVWRAKWRGDDDGDDAEWRKLR